MRKFLFYSTALMFALCLLAGCNDDNEPLAPDPTPDPPVEVPPVLGDIVATYAEESLILTVNGVAGPVNASVTVVQEKDSTMTLRLENVVPGVPVFSLPKSTFEVVSRSAYACNVAGSAVDSLAGYEVAVAGKVADSVLTAVVTLTDMGGVKTNVKSFYNKTYKGDMTIGVSNMPDPVVSMQRVYTSKPTGGDTSSIKLEINNFSFTGIELGNISIDTIKVLKRGNIYAFKAEGRKLALDMIGEVTLDVYGTMVGQTMNLSLLVKAGPLVVNVAFEGDQAVESSDTKITITLPGNAIFEQPVVSKNNYTFKVWASTPASELVLTPKVVLPKGAVLDSVAIYNDETQSLTMIDTLTAIDFSALSETSCVRYYVTPEDVRKPTVKSLFVKKMGNTLYTMDLWVTDAGNNQPTPQGLTNSNFAGLFLPAYGIDLGGKLPVVKGADNAAEIRTFHSVSTNTPNTMLPGVTAGTLFNGAFELDFMSTLKSTKFGELFNKEPATLKFTYKYAPGSVYEKTVVRDSVKANGDTVDYHTTEVVPNMKDSCSISAYLYEVASEKESLDGTNINTSSKVVMKAVFYGVAQANYDDLEIPFVATGNGTYDSTKLYKLAIVCSSSKRGDEFMGAPGSLLTVRRLEVTSK